ncbi:MAG: PilZ domain-containing protein [Spirochaetia bacterium]|nr:PilZ domain-containing protein [Spirochaetia bacterium]
MVIKTEERHKTIIPKDEKRKFRREIFNYKVELLSHNSKNKIKCASFDLSEGGIRVVTNVELKDQAYTVYIDNYKFNAHLVFEEARKSTMMDQYAYYHGLRFEKPITPDVKNKLLVAAKKFRF